MRETQELSQQLDLFEAFDKFDNRCDLFIEQMILMAQNMRWLYYRIQYADLKDRVKKFWKFELDELLDLQAELCASVAQFSPNHYHRSKEQFARLWRKNGDLNMTECPDIESVISHHKHCNIRLKSAILSGNTCLKESGPIIDKIQKQLEYHNRLFNSYDL